MRYRVAVAVAAVVAMAGLVGVARADVTVEAAHVEITVGESAPLPLIQLVEGSSGDIGEGRLVLRAPEGFEFGTNGPVIVNTVLPKDGRCNAQTMLLLGRRPAGTAVEVWPTETEIAVDVTERSRGGCSVTLVWSGIVIRALAVGEGAVTLGGTSTIAGAPEGTAVATLVATAPTAGRVLTWGSNIWGELGVGYAGQSSATPQPAEGLGGATAVAAGEYSTFAVLGDGTVWGWGRNSGGVLADGTTIERHSPVQAQGVSGAVDVAAGYGHALALMGDGTLWSWGGNWSGQLGDGTTTDSGPKPVPGLSDVVAIAAGRIHSLALTSDGSLYAWGENGYGQLGDGTTQSRSTPTLVLSGVSAVAAGDVHTVVLKTDGTVWGFGNNWFGQLGIGRQSDAHPVAEQALGLTNVVSIGAGDFGSFAVTADGTAWGWGTNQFGQLGIGTVAEAQTTPAPVTSLSGVVQVDGGEYHTLFRLTDGSVFAAGSNYCGTLGESWDLVRESTATPVRSYVSGAVDIAATEVHNAAAMP